MPEAKLDVYYVTRPYTTRHGRGPLPHELPGKPYEGIVDETNIPNDWQEHLRFSYLNLDTLKDAINHDRQHLVNGRARLHMTCMDQVSDLVWVIENGEFVNMDYLDLIQWCWSNDLEFQMVGLDI
jgi:adenylosuccinate synthase